MSHRVSLLLVAARSGAWHKEHPCLIGSPPQCLMPKISIGTRNTRASQAQSLVLCTLGSKSVLAQGTPVPHRCLLECSAT